MIDQFSDTWRWWGSLGAAISLCLMRRGIWALLLRFLAHLRGTSFGNASNSFDEKTRMVIGGAMFFAMVAILIAGAIIPLASDGRIAGFDGDHILYRSGMATAWLMWGSSAWTIAIGLSHSRWRMAVASILGWMAVAMALGKTAGMAL